MLKQQRGRRFDRDCGQAVLVLLVAVALCVITVTGLVSLSEEIRVHTQARTAADAAALAAIHGGAASATAVARANGAELVSVVRIGRDVEVVVRVRGATSSARATDAP